MSSLTRRIKKSFILILITFVFSSINNLELLFNNNPNNQMIKLFDQSTIFQAKMFPISYVYDEESILDLITPGPAVITNSCGDQITLSYNRMLDVNSIPSISDFELDARTNINNASGSFISSVSILGSMISLGITNRIESSHEITLAYEPGTNKIRDTDGNLASRVTISVRNNVENSSACGGSSGGGSSGGSGSPGGVTPSLPVINPVQVNVNLFLVLTADQISSISPKQIKTISTNLIKKLSPNSASGLTPDQIKAFNPNQIRFMSVNVISVLSAQQIAGLEPNDFRILTNKQIANISADAAAGISGADLRMLSRNQLKSLKPSAIANMQPAALKSLSVSNLSNLTKLQKSSISMKQKSSLSPAQLRAIKA